MFAVGNKDFQIHELFLHCAWISKLFLRACYVIATSHKHVFICISFWSQVQQIFPLALNFQKCRGFSLTFLFAANSQNAWSFLLQIHWYFIFSSWYIYMHIKSVCTHSCKLTLLFSFNNIEANFTKIQTSTSYFIIIPLGILNIKLIL